MHPLVRIGGLALGAAAAAGMVARAQARGPFGRKLRAVGNVMARGRGGPTPEVFRLLGQRPALQMAVTGYELGLLASSRLDARVKSLASLKAAALVGCPF
jgi:hypothetical protein